MFDDWCFCSKRLHMFSFSSSKTCAGHFQGKVKSDAPWRREPMRNQWFVERSLVSCSSSAAHRHHGIFDTVLKYLLWVPNPHGIVDTSSWQSSCLSTLDRSLLFDLHFSQPLSNHAGLVFHGPARSIWPPCIVFLGMAPRFSSFLSLSRSLLSFKNRVILMFTMTANVTRSHTTSAHGFQGCVSKQCPCQS